MPLIFQAHGEFSLYRDGNILVTSVRGPWNIELIKSWAKATLPYTLEMQTCGVWSAVATVTESMLCPPDAIEALRKSVAYSVHHLGCISHAIVAKPDVAGRGIVEPAFQRAYEGLCVSNFFDDYESAKVWSNVQIQNVMNNRISKI